MRILAITNLYPRPGLETLAAFNRQQFKAIAEQNDLRVINPVPWTQGLSERRAGKLPKGMYRNGDGLWVDHPIFYFPPRIWQHRYGQFFLQSIRPAVDRLLDTFQPEAILACWAHPDGWAAATLARQLGLPCLVKVHGSDVLINARGRRRDAVAEGLRLADGVLVVGRDLGRHVVELGVDPSKVHVLREGLDGDKFYPGDKLEARQRLGLPPQERLVLFVGNLLLTKGLGVLVQAVRLMADRGEPFHCLLVGRGRDEVTVRAMIDEYHVADRFTLTGPRPHDELPDWYRAADLLALPSFSEGIPNVLRESAACGCPYVATRVGGIPEIAHPDAGLLVEAHSAPDLADAIVRVLAHAPDPSTVAATSRFVSWADTARQFTDLFQELIDRRHAPSPQRHANPIHP